MIKFSKLTADSETADYLFKLVSNTQDLMFNLPSDKPQKAVDVLAHVPLFFKSEADGKMHRISTAVMHNPILLQHNGCIYTKKPLLRYFANRIAEISNVMRPDGKPAKLDKIDYRTIHEYVDMQNAVTTSKRKYFVLYTPVLSRMKNEKGALTDTFALECQAQLVVDFLQNAIMHPATNGVFVGVKAERKEEAVAKA